jgi:hypothetical protein
MNARIGAAAAGIPAFARHNGNPGYSTMALIGRLFIDMADAAADRSCARRMEA